MREIFRKKCKIITFKHLVWSDRHFNRVLALMISTESHTPKNEEKHTEIWNFYRYSKNDIFQEISKSDKIFHYKWNVRVFVL